MSDGIFISYRRDDTRHVAARLRNDLSARFGKPRVFRDIDAIEAGTDFTVALQEALSSCSVLVALIGDQWLTLTNADGQRRIDDPKDWTVREILEAQKRKIRVIPILVEGAAPLRESAVPDTLIPLTRLQALPLADTRWRGDLQNLVETIERLDRTALQPTAKTPQLASKRIWIIASVLVLLGLAAVLNFRDPSRPARQKGSQIVASQGAIVGAESQASQPTTPPPETVSKMDAFRGTVVGTASQATPLATAAQVVPVVPDLSGTWYWISGNEKYQFVQDGRRFEIDVSMNDKHLQVGKGNGYLEDELLRMVLDIKRGAIRYGTLECNLKVSKDLKSMEGTCALPEKVPMNLTR